MDCPSFDRRRRSGAARLFIVSFLVSFLFLARCDKKRRNANSPD
jgi:hypothetical protein